MAYKTKSLRSTGGSFAHEIIFYVYNHGEWNEIDAFLPLLSSGIVVLGLD
jgi:hypothetical protein